MTHKTKGIVLRLVKYGETSVVATIYTRKFGMQTYMVNGIRTARKNASSAMMQAGAILDMEVYHNELKGMQRIKEFGWSVVCQHLFSDILKNSILVFFMEMLLKTIRQPESNEDLFHFCEDCLLFLDNASASETANFPLYISLQLPQFLGFKIQNPEPEDLRETSLLLDLKEGYFVREQPVHPYFLDKELSHQTTELLKALHPSELNQIRLNQDTRRKLLNGYLQYYALHLPDFGPMKTLKILQEVLQ